MPSPSSSLRRARPWLGTVVDIAIEGPEHHLDAAMAAAFAAIETVHGLMSFHEAASDVSRINAVPTGVEIAIDPHTAAVLAMACDLSERSAGAFDITTAARLVVDGFLPPHADFPTPDKQADYRDLRLLDGNRVRWLRKGWIDLGGVAKGYAVDCAVAELQAHGVSDGVVNAGGDLRCFGRPQAITVRHPFDPGRVLALGYLTDAAIATSAGYFSQRTIADGIVEPLVDPAHGRCVSWRGSTSVVAPDCATADALTKIVRLAPERALDMLARLGAQAIVVDEAGVRSAGATLLQSELEQTQ
ncbi:MAG: FAD:protein FMN transferase [Burkholderiales bacterium]|nr:FAD:protein FMN transferase [Burkholderiales bacterium]